MEIELTPIPIKGDPRYVRIRKTRDPLGYTSRYLGKYGIIKMTLGDMFLVYLFSAKAHALFFIDELERANFDLLK